jgi:hypothetical protein
MASEMTSKGEGKDERKDNERNNSNNTTEVQPTKRREIWSKEETLIKLNKWLS